MQSLLLKHGGRKVTCVSYHHAIKTSNTFCQLLFAIKGGMLACNSPSPVFVFTPPSGRSLVIPIFFPWFFSFFWWSLAPDLRFSLGRTNTSCRRSVNRSTIFSRLASIRQNLHQKRCRKLLAMQWHKTLFDESENEDASKL